MDMNIEYLKEKKEIVSVVLFGCSVVFAFFILVKLGNCFIVSARAENLAEAAIAQNNTDISDMEAYIKPSKDLADKLKRNNLFSPSEPDEHPVKEVRAIFGDEVLIENKWYEVGQMVGEAKIVAIDPTKVKIEWQGRERDFEPINASLPEAERSERQVARGGDSGQDRADMVVIGSDNSASFQDRGGRRGFGDFQGTRGGRGAMGGFPGQSGMRERFQMMSEAERETLRNEMRERFGRGGGGFGRGGGGNEGFFNRGEGSGGSRQGRGRGGGRGGQ